MKEIRIACILFDGRLSEREIPSFRGAVMGIAGNDPLFHNHTEDAKDINRYPRIQYKLIDGLPAVVGILEGADAVKRLFIRPGIQGICGARCPGRGVYAVVDRGENRPISNSRLASA